MLAEEMTESSVLVSRQSCALTVLLDKFKTQSAALATVGTSMKTTAFQNRTAHSQTVVAFLVRYTNILYRVI